MNFIKRNILIILFFPVLLYGQKDFTLQQVILDPQSLSPVKLEQFQWIPGTEEFSYVEIFGTEKRLISEGIEDANKKIILTFDELNNALVNAGIDKTNSFPGFSWYSKNEIWFWSKNKLVLLDVNNKSASVLNEINKNGENLDFTDPKKIAYTIDNNLFVADNFNQTQITNDTDKGIVNGQIVHRNEFGITKGIFWSPESNYIAFYRKDQTMVTDYPIFDISQKPAAVRYIKYPMAGMTSEEVTVGVYNMKTGLTIFLKTGEPKDQYLPCVTWSPDEKYIFISQLNRDQNHLKLSKYGAATGELVSVLFEERNEKYVEPEHGPIFFKDDPELFIWYSRNEGWYHLSLYDAAGNKIKKLTVGNCNVTEFDGFDQTGTNIFYTSTQESPLDRHYYRLSLDNYESQRITSVPGNHKVFRGETSKYFIDEYSSITIPYQADLLDKDGKLVRTIYSAKNPLEKYNTGSTDIMTLKSKDGYDLFSIIIYPPDFDNTKKYPVIVYVYGGPHDQLIKNQWLGGANLWLNFMAQKGFIIFTLDNRGSANRGLEFEQRTFRRLGTVEIEDQLTGIEYLKSLPYVDPERMGVFGWSYGGYMTVSLMTRTPDIFKVGVAGAPVIDWNYYEVMYTERYMDTPETNPEGYKESSLFNYLRDLKGKLLLVHGTSDETVVWQHTLLLAESAAHFGINMDYYPYIGHKHGIVGKDKFHLYQKITNYFIENMGAVNGITTSSNEDNK